MEQRYLGYSASELDSIIIRLRRKTAIAYRMCKGGQILWSREIEYYTITPNTVNMFHLSSIPGYSGELDVTKFIKKIWDCPIDTDNPVELHYFLNAAILRRLGYEPNNS